MTFDIRVGQGFDVHALVEGRPLIMGGVTIPYPLGLLGHSDADVLLHALTDAILGTIAAGDIGHHFPPSDPQWRGAASDIFLRHAVQLVAARGGRIALLDATVLCEAPKIAPHANRIAQGDSRSSGIVWRGYVHDVLTIACLAAFVYSLGWIGPALKRARGLGMHSRGLCPSCGYRTQGLPSEKCPECGNTWRPE